MHFYFYISISNFSVEHNNFYTWILDKTRPFFNFIRSTTCIYTTIEKDMIVNEINSKQ